jgi:hypothetical protein
LQDFGIESESDLLNALKDPIKCKLTDSQAQEFDMLVAELENTRKELERLQQAQPFRTVFVQRGKNYFPVRIPVTDCPF